MRLTLVGKKLILPIAIAMLIFSGVPLVNVAGSEPMTIARMNEEADIVALIYVDSTQYPRPGLQPCMPRYGGVVVKSFKGGKKRGERIHLGHTAIYEKMGAGYYIVFLRAEPRRIEAVDNFMLEGRAISRECAGSIDYLQEWEDGRGAVLINYLDNIMPDGSYRYEPNASVKNVVSYPDSLHCIEIPPVFRNLYADDVCVVPLYSLTDYLGLINNLRDRAIPIDVREYPPANNLK